MTDFRLVGLDAAPFAHDFDMTDHARASRGARRVVADAEHAS